MIWQAYFEHELGSWLKYSMCNYVQWYALEATSSPETDTSQSSILVELDKLLEEPT